MAGNDNILQAPAQGFGQTVSFSTNPDPRRVPNIDGTARLGQSRGGVQGSPVNGAQQRMHTVEAPPADPTMQLLQKVAGSVLQTKIKEERAAAFVTGMQRAAAGEAIKDIAEGDPWYARIFGDSDVVEGARTYTAQARAAEIAGSIEDSMAEVRKLGPEESNAYFRELVGKHMTGDDATDAVLLQGFARTLPATMRRQAKEHFAWRQEEASKAESAALLSAADLLQKRAAFRGPVEQTDDEYATDAVQFIAGMRPAVGRDVESWTKARTQDLVNLAQAGKFHAVNAIRQAGMLDLLPAEARTRIESALDTAEARTIATKSAEYAPELGRIAGQAEVFSTDLDPQQTFAELQALNARFRRETGIDRDLVSLDKSSGIVKDAHVTILKEGERRLNEAREAAKAAATRGEKAAAEAIKQAGAAQAVSIGAAGPASRAGDGMSSVVREQFLQTYRNEAANGPDAQAALLMRNYTGLGTGDGYVSPDIKDTFERRVDVLIGAQMPADFLQLHEEYAALKRQHPALADAYFGKNAERMAVFDSLLVDGKPGSRNEAMAFVTAFGTQDKPHFKPLGDKERKEARAAVAARHDSPWWRIDKQQREPLREDQLDAAMMDMEQSLAMFRSLPGASLDQAASRAYALAQREKGADMIGGFYIAGSAGQRPLTTYLSGVRPGDSAKGSGEDAADVWDKAMRGKIAELAQRYGADVDDPISIRRMPDTYPYGKDMPVAWMHVMLTGKDGRLVPVPLSSDDIRNYARDPSGRTRGGPVTVASTQ